MPEGPEVRKYADALDGLLTGHTIALFMARTREARKWLEENASRLIGRRVLGVYSHGKHLVGKIDGDFYFHSHLMMWGRWLTFTGPAPAEIDRRERARIVVDGGAAIMFSGPIFNVGEGDPRRNIEHLQGLGPDVLPYEGAFDEVEFRRRLTSSENRDLTIGVALLDQRIVAGLGNYLRAEVLFACELNPWAKVRQLTKRELNCLSRIIPELALRSYLFGATASDHEREQMKTDAALVYQPGREMGTRHLVFRRTNLPCLRCSQPIKQLRQTTSSADEEDRSRITYFCAHCQRVNS